MKQKVDIAQYLKPVGTFFRRFHLTIFIVIIVSALAYAVLSLNSVISEASTANTSTDAIGTTSFDQATINRLNQLSPSESAPETIVLPAGRINPFGE